MDPYELNYDNMDAVPEAVRPFYVEGEDGKAAFNVGAFNGLKTNTDVGNVQEALRKERADHKAAADALKPWSTLNLKPEEVQASLARIPELEAAAEGKLDDDKINGIVETRIAAKTAPLTHQVTTLTEERNALAKDNETLRGQILTRDRNEAIRAVATEMKVIPEAVGDVEMIVGSMLERDETTGQFTVKADSTTLTPGADIKQAMREMQKSRPYWWPQSAGGGGKGGGSTVGGQANPWHKDNWNLTEQGKIVRDQGSEVANQMAKAAGVTVGAVRPAG